ncbi:MAG: HAD family hydrolase [Anaerolineae bacterium]
MNSIKGVIFDLGGTLIYFDADWDVVTPQGAADLAAFLTGHGLALDQDAFARAFVEERGRASQRAEAEGVEYTARMTLQRTLAAFGHVEVDDSLLTQGVETFFGPEERHWQAYPDAVATLRRLCDAGYRLALVSNATDDPLIQRLVDRLGFRPWLSPVVTSAAAGIRKPHPAIFTRVLEAWTLPPEACVMIGDNLQADIQGAQQVGMRGILVTMHEHPSNAQHGASIVPDAQASCLAELPEVIAAL